MRTIISLAMLMAITLMSNAQTKSNHLLEEARKAIEASNAIFSDLANKNDGSILTRYTEDACLLPPNAPPVCGKDKIALFFKDGPKVHSRFKIQHIYGDGKEFVTEESYYEMTDLNGHKLDEGKVVVIWKKTRDGWKMYRDMFSSNRPVLK
jgi:ketosteroid isomerase-like protein